MPTETSTTLTLSEYRQRFANQNGYEYWFGKAVKKPMPTWLHAILQAFLCEVFRRAGYVSGSELELRIDPNWEPRPDVTATLHFDLAERYPTKPVEIVAEILSPDDSMSEVYSKCRHYSRIGIPQVFVFDPEERVAWQWSRDTENLERVHELALGNGKIVPLESVWAELQQRLGNEPQHT